MERFSAAVLDSSVLLKWFRPEEPFAEAAQALRRAYVEERLELVIPDLALYEVANVLRYRGPASAAQQALDSLLELRIPLHRLDAQTLHAATEAAFRDQITVYDAVFLAVAERLRWHLVTADRPFYDAIRRRPRVLHLADLKWL